MRTLYWKNFSRTIGDHNNKIENRAKGKEMKETMEMLEIDNVYPVQSHSIHFISQCYKKEKSISPFRFTINEHKQVESLADFVDTSDIYCLYKGNGVFQEIISGVSFMASCCADSVNIVDFFSDDNLKSGIICDPIGKDNLVPSVVKTDQKEVKKDFYNQYADSYAITSFEDQMTKFASMAKTNFEQYKNTLKQYLKQLSTNHGQNLVRTTASESLEIIKQLQKTKTFIK